MALADRSDSSENFCKNLLQIAPPCTKLKTYIAEVILNGVWGPSWIGTDPSKVRILDTEFNKIYIFSLLKHHQSIFCKNILIF